MRDIPCTEYIIKSNNGYYISKRVNGKQTFLGWAKTLIIALMKRDWCMANDWKKYPVAPCKYTSNYKVVSPYIYERKGKTKNTYLIRKTLGSKSYDYGSYDSLDVAKEIRDALMVTGWKRLPLNPLRHIKKTDAGHYLIQKELDGKLDSFGTFDCLSDAVDEVELLESVGWDLDAWCDLG